MADRESKGGIPDRLVADVLRLSGERQSSRQIAAWLAEAHGVVVSHATVARLLKGHRDERRETTKQIVAEKLGAPEGLTKDLDVLDRTRDRLVRLEARFGRLAEAGGETPSDDDLKASLAALRGYLPVADALRRNVETKLQFAGLEAKDEGAEAESASQQVARRVAQLAARLGAGGAAPPPGTDGSGSAGASS